MDPTQTPSPTDLQQEQQRLWAEIQATQAIANAPLDPAAPDYKTKLADQYVAKQRLDKLNDDYRQILIANRTPAAATDTVTRSDGSVWRIDPSGQPTQVLGPGGKPFGGNQVQTNTTDQYVVSVNQQTGALETVKNPNYVPPKPGQVSANTTDEFIVTMGPDGSLTPTKNPNYQPKPSQISANSTDKFIVQQMPDGTVKSIENPNYQAKTPTTIGGTNTTDQFIVQQNPDGTTRQIPNPNYVPPKPTQVSANTTDQFIVRQNPDGSTSQVPNPNYVAPKPTVVTTDTTSPYIVRTNADGTLSQEPNPNYIKPKPTQLQGGADQQYFSTIDSSGNITSTPNPSYQPKTSADIAARVGQIQTLMQQKSAEVQAKVGKGDYTAEDALKEFNTWYDANVAPQQAQLQAAQDDVQFTRGQELAKTRTSAYTAASAAGTGLTSAFKDMLAGKPMGQSPGFAAAVGQLAKGQTPTNIADLAWKGPNPIDLYQQGTMNALRYIDPTAAAANGLPAPNMGGVDINAALGSKRYAPPGLPPPPPAAAPSGPAGSSYMPGWPGSDPRLSGALNPEPNAPRPLPSQFAHPVYPGLAQGTGTPGPAMPPPQPPMPFGAIAANPWGFASNYSFGG